MGILGGVGFRGSMLSSGSTAESRVEVVVRWTGAEATDLLSS